MNGTDWNRVWQEKIDRASWNDPRLAHRRQELVRPVFAEQFHRDSLLREQVENRAAWITGNIQLDKDTSVLDIGAGTGVLGAAIARRVKMVTAIEPSTTMFSVLRRYLHQEKISNIRLLHQNWEDTVPDTNVCPHHLVLASFSLYMRDIRAALLKMNQLAQRHVCIFTFVGNPSWDYKALWPLLYGREYDVGPDYMDLYNVLHATGIRANIEIRKTRHVQTFDSLPQALTFWRYNLNLSSQASVDRLAAYLERQLIEKDGKLLSSHDTRTAMIWWTRVTL